MMRSDQKQRIRQSKRKLDANLKIQWDNKLKLARSTGTKAPPRNPDKTPEISRED